MNRRERKKEETRNNIIACAISLFKSKGFQQTYMEEIAERSDVSKGTLYNYFPDKESILVEYFQYTISDFGMDIKEAVTDGEDLKTKLYNLMRLKKSIMGDDTELTAIYLKYRLQTLFSGDPFDNPNRSGLENIILEIVKEAQEKKEIRADIPAITIARTFQLITVNYFISNINAKEQMELEMDKLKDQLLELFLSGAKL